MHRSKPFGTIVVVVLVYIQALSLAGCNPTTPATPSPSPTAAQAETATPAVTETLAPSPTGTPAPTATSTPKPTATPEGLYRHANAGFSLVFPSAWEIVKETDTSLVIRNQLGQMILQIVGIAEDKAMTLDEAVAEVEASFDGTQFTPGEKGEVTLADGLTAEYADMQLSDSQGKTDMRLVYTHQGSRGYIAVAYTAPGAMQARGKVLDKLFESLQFFAPQPYDLPHDQTLVMLGSEPDPTDLDPAVTTTSAEDYVGLIYNGLVRLSPDLQIVPGLAETWTISPDGLVYTFTLYADVKFASGKPLTAQHVQDSWERAADPQTGSSTARTYLGDIVGVNEKLDNEADEISGVKVIDDRTLEVTLDGPKPYFLAKLTYPTSFVLDVSTTENGEDWAFSPDASGPYTLKRHTKEEVLIFERNPNSPVKPAIPYVVYKLNPGGSAMSLYTEGTIDLLPVGSTDIKSIEEANDPAKADLTTTASMCTSMLQIDPSRAPLDDVHVRQALALALDKNGISEVLTEGTALNAVSVLPPSMPGYLEGREAPAFDAKAAKDALKASKYAASLPAITLIAAGYAGTPNDSVTTLVDAWKKNLGITVKVEYVDPQEFTQEARNAKGQMTLYSWCADYPDPENFLDVLFHTNSEFNVGHVADPALDALLEKARTEIDGNTRIALYQQAETLVLEQVYSIPMFHSIKGELVKPRVKGFILSPLHSAEIPWLSLEE